MKENYDLKLQVLQKDLDNAKMECSRLAKANATLIKENSKLANDKSQPALKDTNDKLHKFRVETEQLMKSRHQQWQADKAELKQELATCRNAQRHHDSILTEKEKQITNLLEDLTNANTEIIKAKEEAYEAKRTQTITVSADEFTPAGRKTSRSHPLTQTSTESKTSSSVTHPTTHTGVSQPSRTYASVARATPRLNSERAPRRETSELNERANRRPRSSPSKTNGQISPSRDRKRGKQTVVVIGNSHLTHIDTSRLVPQAHVTMLQAYTIDEAAQQLEHSMSFAPSCVVIHAITNDVKSGQSAKAIAEYFQSVIDYYSTKYPETKFIISLGVHLCFLSTVV